MIGVGLKSAQNSEHESHLKEFLEDCPIGCTDLMISAAKGNNAVHLESSSLCGGFRIRFEKGRSRTRERALLAMEQLTNASNAENPALKTRMWYLPTVHKAFIPT